MRPHLGWLAILIGGVAAAGENLCAVEVQCRPADGDARRLVATLPAGVTVTTGARLLVADGVQPVGWAELLRVAGDEATFELRSSANPPPSETTRRVWLIAPDIVSSLHQDWPAEADLYAELDSLGPGGRSAWLGAGTNAGIRVGDRWWLRVAGQPAARCEVRLVAADLCYCTVEPLVSTPVLRAGTRLALWPAPAERRRGEGRSAVAFVEQRGHDAVVWVAAPPGTDATAEPHLDFFRDGRFIGYGRVERGDARFWYARFAPAPTAGGSMTSAPEAGPTTPLAPAVQVGDTVRVRTKSDLEQGRLVARVFEITPAGAAINAGDIDGVTVGQRFTVYRDGRPHGPATVHRVQRSYAVATPADMLIDPPLVLQVGDELRQRPPPAAARAVAIVIRVDGESLLTARLLDAEVPLRRPLAVREGSRTVGVAVLVHGEGGSAVGFALPCAAATPLKPGPYLVLDSPPTD
ncbi:MAG: hypothetical protein AB1601_12015 [Planctomycetota bacterium]